MKFLTFDFFSLNIAHAVLPLHEAIPGNRVVQLQASIQSTVAAGVHQNDYWKGDWTEKIAVSDQPKKSQDRFEIALRNLCLAIIV